MVDTDPGSRSGYARRADASGILLMLGATFFFVSTNVFVKFLVAEDMNVFQVTWGRMVFHWIAFLPLFLLPRYRKRARPNRPRLQLLRSAILYGTNSLFFAGLSFLTLATAASIMYAGPLIVVILSFLFLGEKVGPRRWAAVTLGFAGVLIIMRPDGAFQWAMLLSLGASVGFALYQLITRAVAADDDPLTTMFWTPVVGMAVASVLMLFLWQNPTPLAWLWLACCGVTAGAGQFRFFPLRSLAARAVHLHHSGLGGARRDRRVRQLPGRRDRCRRGHRRAGRPLYLGAGTPDRRRRARRRSGAVLMPPSLSRAARL